MIRGDENQLYAMSGPAARAESSCRRCHRRKKRCDKALPQCRACQHANQRCSYLDDEKETATFSIAYVYSTDIPELSESDSDHLYRYVRGLEMRVKDLEQQLAMFLDMRTTEHEALFGPSNDIDGVRLDFNTRPIESSPVHLIAQPQPIPASPPTQQQQAVVNGQHIPITTHKPDSLADELKLLSLEAAADRHVGSSSGISFAKLTQAVLRRLSPDRQEFVFDDEQDEEEDDDDEAGDLLPNQTETTPTFSFAFNEINTHLVSSPPLPLYFPISNDQQQDGLIHESLSLIEPSHISHLLEFYFAHSHTLYPFVRQHEFTTVLWRLYADPSDPLAQSPLWQFRIWMVLAIGSTAYSSVSLLDESESVQLFNRAMVHFEGAMGCGDLVGIMKRLILR